MKKLNILVIGVGPHARRIYLNVCKEENSNGVDIACGVDVLEKKQEIGEFFHTNNYSFPMFYVSNNSYVKKLNTDTASMLNHLVDKYNINAVIISTDPLAHLRYAVWAIEHKLPILLDKPITAVPNSSINEKKANEILSDFYMLKSIADTKNIVSVMAQRRFHPAYIEIRKLIIEVFLSTNCPITSIQCFHSDGQWRLPSEIMDIDYHSYNHGFGKLMHSGYHFLDMIAWLMNSIQSDTKKANNVDIITQVSRPSDFISQITLDDYQKIFKGFHEVNKYSEATLRRETRNFGEIDVFINFAFKRDENVITLVNSNLIHNGFSQRGWLIPNKDLYKGNGRVRQETLRIEQGPFQSISLISYQSSEINKDSQISPYDMGGEYHLDIHVFRNSAFNSAWKPYRKISIDELSERKLQGYSRGHQEDARRRAIIEFIRLAKGEKIEMTSSILDHEFTVKLMSGAYRSMARRFNAKNPLVNISV